MRDQGDCAIEPHKTHTTYGHPATAKRHKICPNIETITERQPKWDELSGEHNDTSSLFLSYSGASWINVQSSHGSTTWLIWYHHFRVDELPTTGTNTKQPKGTIPWVYQPATLWHVDYIRPLPSRMWQQVVLPVMCMYFSNEFFLPLLSTSARTPLVDLQKASFTIFNAKLLNPIQDYISPKYLTQQTKHYNNELTSM